MRLQEKAVFRRKGTAKTMRSVRKVQRTDGQLCAHCANISLKSQKRRIMLDPTDRALLAALQNDAHSSAGQLSDMLHLSASQISRRRQRLETEGFIQGYTARVDATRMGLSVQGFVQVHLATHGPDNSTSFARMVDLRPEITSAWTMTGDADYLLRVYCADLAALNTLIHDVLLPHPAVARVQSQIVMDQLKRDGPLPTG